MFYTALNGPRIPGTAEVCSLQLFEHLGVVALILKSYQQCDIRQTDALVPQ